MKKIALLVIIILLNIPITSYASWTCLIKDKSAQVLLDYIKDNRKIIENISTWISENNSNEDKNENGFFEKIWNNFKEKYNFTELEGGFNEIFNFKWYESYAKYYAIFPISNEIPSEIKRDYDILKQENEWLISYLKSLNSSWYWKVLILNPCKWVTVNCNYKNSNANDLVLKLIQNIYKIQDLYRLTVMWDEITIETSNLNLVSNNFIIEIEKNYNKKSSSACSDTEWWFFYQIKESISEIKLLNQEWKDWIQKWKDAWQLLIWNEPNKEAELEKKLLKDELSEKWITTDYHSIIQTNLEDYNLEWLSINNNFITNTYDLIKSNTEAELKVFKDKILYDEIDNRIWNKPGSKLSIDWIKKLEKKAEKTKLIQEKIAIIYNNELPFAAIWDISTKNLRAKIIEAHKNVDISINTLEETKPISEKICKDQSWWNSGDWKCTTN